jgi:hypothetical protein
MIDKLPVPDWLEKGIAEAKGQNILYRFLSQVVVDTKDLVFFENPGQKAI